MPPPLKGQKCHPCVRNTVLPISQEGHQGHSPWRAWWPPPSASDACARAGRFADGNASYFGAVNDSWAHGPGRRTLRVVTLLRSLSRHSLEMAISVVPPDSAFSTRSFFSSCACFCPSVRPFKQTRSAIAALGSHPVTLVQLLRLFNVPNHYVARLWSMMFVLQGNVGHALASSGESGAA